MALTTGQLMSGSGAVARGQRRGVAADITIDAAEQALARQRQMDPIAIEEARTLADTNQLALGTQRQLDPIRVERSQAELLTTHLANELNRLRNPLLIAEAARRGQTAQLELEEKRLTKQIFELTQYQPVMDQEGFRQQMQAEVASQGGLRVPPAPVFATGQGQPHVAGLNIPTPSAPPAAPPMATTAAPAAQPTDTVTVGAATPAGAAVPMDMDTGEFPQTGSPLRRAYEADREVVAVQRELSALRNQVTREYADRAAPHGLLMEQTDEERAFAKKVMGLRDKLTKPELEQLLQTGRLPPKAGVKEPTVKKTAPVSRDVSKIAQAYDTTQTPYDALMTQAAQQYGLDPVAFKRLIGSESSFDLDATSERGEQFGYGIAQIADVHGLTREQRRDPNIAIPKAAEILSQYLREANGNYGIALMRYKGASSADGIAAMQAPVNAILFGRSLPGEQSGQLIGKTPAATADNVVRAVASSEPASVGVMYGDGETGVTANNPAVQLALSMRQLYQKQAEYFGDLGRMPEVAEAMTQIAAIDEGLIKSQADAGINELDTSGDAGRVMAVLSHYTGVPTQALSRGDGTYDLYVNGKVAQTALSVRKLSEMVKSQVDRGYRQNKAEFDAKVAIIGLEKGIVLKQEEMKQIGAIQQEMRRGNYALLLEQAKRDGKLTVNTVDEVTFQEIGGVTYAITKNTVTGLSGKPQTVFSRTRVQ